MKNNFVTNLLIFIFLIMSGFFKLENNNVYSIASIPFSSYQFKIGSNIVRISEYFQLGKGENTLRYPILQKISNGVSEYFIAEDDIHTIFFLWQTTNPIKIEQDKVYETYWFSPNNQYIHFKWKSNGSKLQFNQEVFVNQERATWRTLPIEKVFQQNGKSIKKVLYPLQSICELLHYTIRVDMMENIIMIKDIFGKTQTITIGSLIVSYVQMQGTIEYDFYLNTPISIKENHSMIDIQPLLCSDKFPTYSENCSSDQYKPYYWEINYHFRDKNNKLGVFTEYAYTLPGKEKIWTNEYFMYDGQKTKWPIKPEVVGTNRIENYEMKSNILIPLRFYFEMVGYKVSWDKTKSAITAKP